MLRVRWKRPARDYLAAMFMAADDAPKRAAIASAFKQINEELANDPSSLGESRDEGRRIHFVRHRFHIQVARRTGGGLGAQSIGM